MMFLMKYIVLFFFLLTAGAGFAQDSAGVLVQPVSMDSLFAKKEMESIGKLFPAFEANFNGHTLTKDSLQGKVIFINFWFEACPPCVAELDALNNLYKKFRPFRDFQFISFSYESPADILLLKKKFKIEYPVVSVNRQECYRLNQNNGFPTSIILDRQGIIRFLYTGGSTDKKEAADFIAGTVYHSLESTLQRNSSLKQ